VEHETTFSAKDIAARVHLDTSKGANANLHGDMRRSSLPGDAQHNRERKPRQAGDAKTNPWFALSFLAQTLWPEGGFSA
jgi:hypothetical protein